MYSLLDSERCRPRVFKVKSHITVEQKHFRLTPPGHIYVNELADVAAGRAAGPHGPWHKCEEVC